MPPAMGDALRCATIQSVVSSVPVEMAFYWLEMAALVMVGWI